MKNRDNKGFTLVEILVATLISITLLLAVLRLFSRMGETFEMNSDSMQLMETTRVALKFVKNDLTQAGYMGCVQTDVDPRAVSPEVLVQSVLNRNPRSYWGVSGQDGGSNPDTLSMFYMQDLDIRVLTHDTNGTKTGTGISSFIVDAFNVFDASGNAKISEGDWLVVSNCAEASSFILTNNPTALAPTIAMGFGADAVIANGQVSALQYTQGVDNDGDGFLNQNSYSVLRTDKSYNSHAGGGATMVGRYFDITYQVAGSMIDGGATQSLFRLVNGEAPSKTNEIVRMVKDFQVTYGVDSDGDGVANQVINNLTGVSNINKPVQVRVAVTIAGDLSSQELVNIVKIRNKGL